MRILPSYRELPRQLHSMLLRSWQVGCFASEPGDGTGADMETPRLPLDAFASMTRLLEGCPQSFGRLFGEVQNCATTATVFLLQCPPSEDVAGFYASCYVRLFEWYSEDTTKPDILGVVHTFVAAHLMSLSHMENFDQFRLMLLPYTPQRVEVAYDMTWRVPGLFLGGLIDTLLPVLKQRWSFDQFEEFACSFVQTVCMDLYPDLLTEDMIYSIIQLPSNFETYLCSLGEQCVDYADVEYTVSVTQDDLNKIPIGPRIPMYEFCHLVLPVESGTTCAICKEPVDSAFTEEENEPVATNSCGHHFHALCLDTWVSASAVPSSGTCPLCRTMLCRTRSCASKALEAELTSGEQTMMWD